MKFNSVCDGTVTMSELKEYITTEARQDAVDKYSLPLDPVIITDTSNPGIWQLAIR